jgi:hypothetical protein
MYVCVYVCMYVSGFPYVYVCMCRDLPDIMHVCTYIVRLTLPIYSLFLRKIRTHIHIHTLINSGRLPRFPCMYVRMYVCMYVVV